MRRLLPLLVLICSAIASAQVRDVYYQGYLTPLNIMPSFDRGYLVVYDTDHRTDVFGPDGALLYRATVRVPGAGWAEILNGAVDSDGTLALAVEVASPAGAEEGGGIVLFDRSGAQIRYFETKDFLPTQVDFGPDHAIWAIGWLGNERGPTEDYSILRKYARDGRELGRFLPRSSFPAPDDHRREPMILPDIGLWQLRVAGNRVEAALYRARTLVETDLNGREIGRWDMSPGERPYAITANGQVWGKEGNQLRIFDRSAGMWRPVTFTLPNARLIGAEGNDLVFKLRDGTETLRWMPAPAVAVSTADAISSH